MGLSISTWLCERLPGDAPAPSSAFRPLAVPTSSRLRLLLSSSAAAPGDRRSRWSQARRSPHFLLSACKEEARRSPAEMSSDGVRAEMGAARGLHAWEVAWSPGLRGSHAVVGVSLEGCPLQASGYNVLVGGDSQSWGWELRTNQLWHNGRRLGCYPPQSDTVDKPLAVPERILLVLDADAGTLGFVVDGHFLGVAFRDLPRGVELFPAVSSVRGGASIRLRYLNSTTRDPPDLMALCGLTIRQNLGQQKQNKTKTLPLPVSLQQYLLSSQDWALHTH